MHIWRRPLSQSRVFLAADARIPAAGPASETDVVWTLHQRSALPRVPALETRLGLHVRSLVLFPVFAAGEKAPWVVDTGEYARPPELWACLPDYAHVYAQPFPWLEFHWETAVVDGRTLLSRVHWTYTGSAPQPLLWGWAGLLRPLQEGTTFEPQEGRVAAFLLGRTPLGYALLYMTGGPQGEVGPYPMLLLRYRLAPGEARAFAWVWTLDEDVEAGLTRARRWAARSWEALKAQRDLLDAHTPYVFTGRARVDWALGRGRQSASRFLVRTPLADRDYPVLRRLPEDPPATRANPDNLPTFPELWYWLTQYGIPAVQPWVPGLVEALLAVRNQKQEPDDRPALWGGQAQYLAHPLAIDLAARVYATWQDAAFLQRVFPHLWELLQAWFAPQHDRDRDLWPEWENPVQVGLPYLPEFTWWSRKSTGLDIHSVESPALLAFLYRACRQVASLARHLEREEEARTLENWAQTLHESWKHVWSSHRALAPYRDRDTHHTHGPRRVWQGRGAGSFPLEAPADLTPPARLVVHLFPHRGRPSQFSLYIHGRNPQGRTAQALLGPDRFHWAEGRGVATTEAVFARVERVVVEGLARQDRVVLRVADLTRRDLSLLTPLWAGLLTPTQADALIRRHLGDEGGFGRPGGWSVEPGSRASDQGKAVPLWWNGLLLEGLIQAGKTDLAVRRLLSLLEFQGSLLDREGLFFELYHGEMGLGLAPPETMTSLPPLGLVLRLGGIRFLPGLRMALEGPSAFPFPLTVDMWGARVVRRPSETEVRLPWGETLRLEAHATGLMDLRTGAWQSLEHPSEAMQTL